MAGLVAAVARASEAEAALLATIAKGSARRSGATTAARTTPPAAGPTGPTGTTPAAGPTGATPAARTASATPAATRAAAAEAAGATRVATTSAITSAAAAVKPILAAASGRGAGQHVDGVIEVALLLDPGELLLALDHAHEAHAVRTATHDLERLHQASQAITRHLHGRGHCLGDGPRSGRGLWLGGGRRGHGPTLGGRLRGRGSLDATLGRSIRCTLGGRGGLGTLRRRGLGTLRRRGLGTLRRRGLRTLRRRGLRGPLDRGWSLGRGGSAPGGRRLLVPAARASIVGPRRQHGAPDLGGLTEQRARELSDRLHGMASGRAMS
jgi:hypothetical protein